MLGVQISYKTLPNGAVCALSYTMIQQQKVLVRTHLQRLGENYTNYITDVSPINYLADSLQLNWRWKVKIQTRITDDKREVKLKGKDTTQITNYCSYILNTNNTNSVNAGDKDRTWRFCVIPCVNKKINDKVYFANYEKNINNNPEAITTEVYLWVPQKAWYWKNCT